MSAETTEAAGTRMGRRLPMRAEASLPHPIVRADQESFRSSFTFEITCGAWMGFVM